MANSVSRQYEIMKIASQSGATSRGALADKIEAYNKSQIAAERPSAFQRNLFNETIPIKASTIQKYVSLAVSLGVLDIDLKPKAPLDGTQNLDGFTSTLQDLLADYCEPMGFGYDQLATILKNRFRNKTDADLPVSAPTLNSLIEEIQPGVSDFYVGQCLDMFQMLYEDFQFTQVRMVLHRSTFWSAS